jgi:hypothetical protein
MPSNMPVARTVAQKISEEGSKALAIAIADMEEMALQMSAGLDGITNADVRRIREQLITRMKDVSGYLPTGFKKYPDHALMHIDHEEFRREYKNETTLVSLEPVQDISREKFLCTENDGYAWDLDELVATIGPNGVVRNPYTKAMFSERDQRRIFEHEIGKQLQLSKITQNELLKSISVDTANQLNALGKILLSDIDESQTGEVAKRSRHGLWDLIKHMRTLPQQEQLALEQYRFITVDSHTRQQHNITIAETVTDAGENLCLHKAGKYANDQYFI